MKQILIIRHAKTEQTNYDKDFNRQLTERGQSDCILMSKRLSNLAWTPDCILVSTAKRTIQTSENLIEYAKWEKSAKKWLDSLYLANAETIAQEVMKTNNQINLLAIVGHNPGITDFFNLISNSSWDDMPTLGMGLINLPIDSWDKLEKGSVEWVSWPKKS